ncbi:transcription factor atf21 [Pochonia chlamydosporia 170]|uniref:Transcription factor atf21 n=1 Tax=Pochonia chlamydosporia 170 TaxID=1380566 RepID=A0A179EXN2_METCM|nr:transcription factor atf21 [Pochonia chlamydosporia 170]OAQ57946.1 transcription factor atf21 [Pochonia chlamydosporia 170]
METIRTEHQPSHFIMDAVDYSSWGQGELGERYLESCNTDFSNPFDETSPESCFDGDSTWMDGCGQLNYPHSHLSPRAVLHAFHAPEVTNSVPTESTQTPLQETPISSAKLNPNPKRKTTTATKYDKINIVNSKLKRACRSRSKSSSPATPDLLLANKEKVSDEDDTCLERSRVASNKFRERKRYEIAQLESKEYTMEDLNRQLRGMLDALASEILSLKMQLLQHTSCNCELIQVYISKEAHHFVESTERCQGAGFTK